MPDGGTLDVKFPEKLEPLFEAHRYKAVVGGRGKGASWGIARALLILGYQKPLRILCTREIQRTIADSVHQLLQDQIEKLSLGAFYKITEGSINGLNGTRFAFTGLHNLTADNLKSYEGFDVCWVAEAQSISKRSWSILIPTIRKEGSEIWLDLNPQLDSDETYQRFVEHTPPDTALIRMSWRDNPWFPAVLEKERKYLEERDPEAYQNVWEGKCRTSVEGAIYANEIRDAIEGKRIRPVPYDPLLKVHTVWDLGFNDTMSIIFCQRLLNQLMVIDYLEDDHKKYDWYVSAIREKKYNLGKCYLPHDAGHESPLLAPTPVKTLRQLGLDVEEPLLREPVEVGIKRVRQTFNRIYFDEVKAKELVDHLKRYRRAIPVTTNEPQAPLHDEHSHAADALRYLCAAAESMQNEPTNWPKIKYPEMGIV
jgi:phage terminase large subunit